jgi:Ni,Fe-hydrogenase I cytochrome b subunit
MGIHWVTALSVFALIFTASVVSRPPANALSPVTELAGRY